MFLALLLFIGAAGLIFAYLGTEDPKPNVQGPSPTAKSEKFEKSVNKHLMFTNEKMELERQRMQVENARLLNSDFSSTQPQHAYQNDNKLDLSTDTRAEDLAKELGRGERAEDYSTPHDVVQKELFNAQQARSYSQAYKEEYARQFVENARRGGYKVILSEDLSRVISVTPIRNPGQSFNTNMELFGSGSDALQ